MQATTEVKMINRDEEDGLKVIQTSSKGRGVVATKMFSKGEPLCEYAGQLLSIKEARQKESSYKQDDSIGSYMYYFYHKSRKLW